MDEASFNELKRCLTAYPVLHLPDFEREFKVTTDASNEAIGAVLSQKDDLGREHPIAYASQRLGPREQRYATREKELWALIYSLHLWRPYLYQRHFVAETDHQSLIFIQTAQDLTPKLARWNDELQEYDFTIKHRPGKGNVVADALTRPPCVTNDAEHHSHGVGENQSASDASDDRSLLRTLLERKLRKKLEANEERALSHIPTLAIIRNRYLRTIQTGYEKDPFYSKITMQTLSRFPNYRIDNGLIYVKSAGKKHFCIPTNCREVINAISHAFHESNIAGHPGIQHCYAAIRERYYWTRMYIDVEKYFRTCPTCQRNKPAVLSKQTIQPLDVPKQRFEEISMDFITDMPSTKNAPWNAITVTVDRLTKKILLYPTHP